MKLNLINLVLCALILGADAKGFFSFASSKSSSKDSKSSTSLSKDKSSKDKSSKDKLTKEEKEEKKISRWSDKGDKFAFKSCSKCRKCLKKFEDPDEREVACETLCEQCPDVDVNDKSWKFDGLKRKNDDHMKHSLDLKLDGHMKHSLDLHMKSLKLGDHLKHSLDLKLDDHLKHSLDLHMKSLKLGDHLKHSLDLKLDDHMKHSLDLHMHSLKLGDHLKLHSLDLKLDDHMKHSFDSHRALLTEDFEDEFDNELEDLSTEMSNMVSACDSIYEKLRYQQTVRGELFDTVDEMKVFKKVLTYNHNLADVDAFVKDLGTVKKGYITKWQKIETMKTSF